MGEIEGREAEGREMQREAVDGMPQETTEKENDLSAFTYLLSQSEHMTGL